MWFRFARKSLPTQATRSRRGAYRPQIEALENRCLLSAGALDPTFGNGAGYVTTSFSTYRENAHTALIQPDGKILASGGDMITNGSQFAVVRYNPDGSPDTSFGSGGTAEAGLGANNAADNLGGATLQSDGKIVMAGLGVVSGHNLFFLARFNSNGTLDATFGNQGEVTTSFSAGTPNGAAGIGVQSDGKIVATGDNNSNFELARYNVDGSLDNTFGAGGEVVSAFAQFPSLSARGVLQQADGKLIVVGDTNGNAPNDWVLARYNANGSLDTSFGNQGIVATPVSGEPIGGVYGGKVAVLYPNAGTPNDGKIVVGGNDSTGTWQFVRYNANGSLDSTFGTGGDVVTQISGSVSSVTLDANGRVVATGANAAGTVAELARFNLDGTPDTTFGAGGLVTTTVGVRSQGRGIAIYPNAGTANDGEIVVVGVSNNGTKANFLVARYLGDSAGFTVTGFPSPSTAGVASTFTVTAKDANGNVLTGYTGTVHFTSSDPHAVLPADYTFTAADQGVHTFSATLKTAGSQSITATDTTTAIMLGSESGITITPAAASQFILSAPSSVSKGAKFSLTLTVEDAYGNVVTGYVGTVHFTSSDGTATLPVDYTFTAADAGVHTFVNKSILRKKGKQTITVMDTLNSALTATDNLNVV